MVSITGLEFAYRSLHLSPPLTLSLGRGRVYNMPVKLILLSLILSLPPSILKALSFVLSAAVDYAIAMNPIGTVYFMWQIPQV